MSLSDRESKKSAKKPKITVLDLFTLKDQMSKGARAENPTYIALQQDIASVINTIAKLAHEDLKGESKNMEEFYDKTRTRIIFCNEQIIALLTTLKKKYSNPELIITKEDRSLIDKTFDYVIHHAQSRIEKSKPYKSSLAVFFKDSLGDSKYIHCQDKDLLLTGGVETEATPEFKYFPGGGLCAGLVMFQCDQASQKKVNFIPLNSESLMYYHLNQKKLMKDALGKTKKIVLRKPKDGPLSGYMFAQRVIDNLDQKNIYIIEMKGHHALMVRMLPPNSSGYKYEFCDPGLHVGYHKTEDELIADIATCYDLNTSGLNTVSTYITMTAFAENSKTLPAELISFFENQQKQNNVTLSNVYDLFLNKEGILSFLLMRAITEDSTPIVVATTVLNLFLRSPELLLSKTITGPLFQIKFDTDNYYHSMMNFLLEQIEVIKEQRGDEYKALQSSELEEQLSNFYFKLNSINEYEDALSSIGARLEELIRESGSSHSEKPREWQQLIEIFKQTKDIDFLNKHLSLLTTAFGSRELFSDIQKLHEDFMSHLYNANATSLLIEDFDDFQSQFSTLNSDNTKLVELMDDFKKNSDTKALVSGLTLLLSQGKLDSVEEIDLYTKADKLDKAFVEKINELRSAAPVNELISSSVRELETAPFSSSISTSSYSLYTQPLEEKRFLQFIEQKNFPEAGQMLVTNPDLVHATHSDKRTALQVLDEVKCNVLEERAAKDLAKLLISTGADSKAGEFKNLVAVTIKELEVLRKKPDPHQS